MKLSIIFQVISVAIVGSHFGDTYALDDSVLSSPLKEASNRQFIEQDQKRGFTSFLRRTAEEDHDGDHDEDHDEDHEDEPSSSKPWGEVIGFTLLVNLVTLSGVIFLVFPSIRKSLRHPVVHALSPAADKEIHAHKDEQFDEDVAVKEEELAQSDEKEHSQILDIFIPSFAAGALLATVVFLVLPESMNLLNNAISESAEAAHAAEEAAHAAEGEAHEEEEESHEEGEILTGAIWRFGAGILGGIMLPILFGLLFPRSVHHEQEEKTKKGNKIINYSLALSILVGDSIHNFCDGIFIGVAFNACDNTTAYTIVFVTLYHEIAQELADFFLLTKHAGLSPVKALAGNFVAGLSVVLGGIVVLAVDVSDLTIGAILSISAGVYIYIAATECLPRVNEVVKSHADRLLSMFAFIVGAVPIGLTLLGHSHCDAHHGEH